MFYFLNQNQTNNHIYSYIDSNVELFFQPYKNRYTNTVFIQYTDLHSFFLDFLKNHIYSDSDMSEIPFSYNLLTNIQSVLKLYVYKYCLLHGNQILLDENLNKIIDGCIKVCKNRYACKEKIIKFEKIFCNQQTYVSYNTLMNVANICLINKNSDFFFLKRKYLIYICIKYNIPSFLIKCILDYYY
jgi:hypothetical protein